MTEPLFADYGQAAAKPSAAQQAQLNRQRAIEVAQQVRAENARRRLQNQKESDQLEKQMGPVWDAMNAEAQQEFAQSVLDPFLLKHWSRSPDSPLIRETLLDALLLGQSNA